MIALVDYDAGNLLSVYKAFKKIGADIEITSDKDVIRRADKLVLPGVGAFDDCMQKLKELDLIIPIQNYARSGKPFLGICLGMQLLFETSEEVPIGSTRPVVEGLGILKGCIKKFPKTPGYKIPHMGWNTLHIEKETLLFRGITEGAYVYFVHSYALEAIQRETVATTTSYIHTFDSAIAHENLYGCQFHPEKSSDIGLQILDNFSRG